MRIKFSLRARRDADDLRDIDHPPCGQAPGVHQVVVGLDGSPASWDAFAWAAGDALRTGGRLVVVYAAPPPPVMVDAAFDHAADRRARELVVEELQNEAERAACDLGVPIRFVREEGSADRALTRVARSLGADCIVVGRSTKLRHQVAGSAGRRLASRRDAPVIVVVP